MRRSLGLDSVDRRRSPRRPRPVREKVRRGPCPRLLLPRDLRHQPVSSLSQCACGTSRPRARRLESADAIALDWRASAEVAFLVGDAPPHLDYPNDVPYDRSALEAPRRGIRVHAVAASGLETYPNGALVFRRIAQLTRGKFVFIEYGSIASSAAMHGVAGEVASNNLDEILFRQIREELEG